MHPRDEILQTMQRIYRYRMTTTSGGNVSIRDGEDIWITPARIDKGNLRREDIVCVRSDGTSCGLHPPSSEFPFHRGIYRARPDIQAVVHAHPVALVAFSICRQVPDTRLFHQSHFVCGNPALAPYALPGSEQLAEILPRPLQVVQIEIQPKLQSDPTVWCWKITVWWLEVNAWPKPISDLKR